MSQSFRHFFLFFGEVVLTIELTRDILMQIIRLRDRSYAPGTHPGQ